MENQANKYVDFTQAQNTRLCYCFTQHLGNVSLEEAAIICTELKGLFESYPLTGTYVFQTEYSRTQLMHIQGVVKFKRRVNFYNKQLGYAGFLHQFSLSAPWLESTRNLHASKKYCSSILKRVEHTGLYTNDDFLIASQLTACSARIQFESLSARFQKVYYFLENSITNTATPHWGHSIVLKDEELLHASYLAGYILQHMPEVLVVGTSELSDFKSNLSKVLLKSLTDDCTSHVKLVFIYQDESYSPEVFDESRIAVLGKISGAMYHCLAPVKTSVSNELLTNYVYKGIQCLCLSCYSSELKSEIIVNLEL